MANKYKKAKLRNCKPPKMFVWMFVRIPHKWISLIFPSDVVCAQLLRINPLCLMLSPCQVFALHMNANQYTALLLQRYNGFAESLLSSHCRLYFPVVVWHPAGCERLSTQEGGFVGIQLTLRDIEVIIDLFPWELLRDAINENFNNSALYRQPRQQPSLTMNL